MKTQLLFSQKTNEQYIEGEEKHLKQINELYNYYIKNTYFTFDIEPWSIEKREQWFQSIQKNPYAQLLVCLKQDKLIGYACAFQFRPKAAYQTSVETSIYVCPSSYNQKIGRKLYTLLLQKLNLKDVHRAYAFISLPNDISERFHKKFEFENIGQLTEVGRKFGKFYNVKIYEKKIS